MFRSPNRDCRSSDAVLGGIVDVLSQERDQETAVAMDREVIARDPNLDGDIGKLVTQAGDNVLNQRSDDYLLGVRDHVRGL